MNEADEQRRRHPLTGILIALFAPVLILYFYFLVFEARSAASDWAAVAIAFAAGAVGVLLLPLRIWVRAVLLAGYAAFAAYIAVGLALAMACAIQGLASDLVGMA